MRGALLLLVAVLAACAGEYAPAEPQITGFDGIPWGTTRDAIVASKGDPLDEVDETGGIHRLRYVDTLLGERVFVDYWVDTFSEGLMGGMYNLDAPTPGECASLFTAVRGSLETRYPDLPTERRGGAGSAGFCGSPEGSFTGHRWDDPANGATVILGRVGGDRWIAVEYGTPSLDAWRDARAEHRSRSRF